MRKLSLCLLFVLPLSGCATTPLLPQVAWYKPGAGRGELARDRYACALETSHADEGNPTRPIGQMLFDFCMHSKGWTLWPQ
jgi:hypothetical protein